MAKAKSKVIEIGQLAAWVKDGSTIMVGGFLGCGSPNLLTDAIFDMGMRDLTIIANDSTRPGFGVGKLIANRRVKKLITSHIGTNPETGKQMNKGSLDVELVPQGTLAERIRAGGAGLGAVVTPTGVGTIVQEGKRTIDIFGRTYLVELPLRASIALIYAERADEMGNLYLRGSTRNMNPMMATAADTVICEVGEIVPVGAMDPNIVTVPGVYVDYMVRRDA